ncbi:MAG: EAL domain-containing protein [Spirochaetia bacterium]|nr:EAL domain-containing protein [Spirochaetia bacterium]
MNEELNQNEKSFLLGSEDFCQNVSDILNKRFSRQYIIVACKINQLTKINQLYGYKGQNEVFHKVLHDLRQVLVKNTIFCKYGFSEFLFFCEYDTDFLQRFRSVKFFDCKTLDIRFPVTINSGMYIIQDSDLNVQEMINNSILAVKKEFSEYKNTTSLYTESQDKLYKENRNKLNSIKEYLDENKITILFQPQYDAKTMELIGAEVFPALTEGDKRDFDKVDFLPLLEESGYIFELDKYVLRKLYSEMKNWLSNGVELLPITVNISKAALMSEEFCSFLNQLHKEFSVPVEYIHFDISTSVFQNSNDVLIDRIFFLKKLGYTIGCDNFYADSTSLIFFKEFPIEYLKIDFEFLNNVGNIDKNGKLVGSVAKYCSEFNLVTFAENIKTEYQADFVNSINCNIVQGNYYKEKMDATSFLAYMTNEESKIYVPEPAKEQSIDFDKLIDPNSQENMIFEVLNGPSAVIEFISQEDRLRILKCNKKFLKILDINLDSSMQEVLRHFNEIFTGESYKDFFDAIKKSTESRNQVSCVTKHDFGIPDRETWIKSNIFSVGKKNDREILYVLFEDISEEKRNKNQISSTNNLLEILIENAQVGISLFHVKLDTKNIFDSIQLKVLKTNHTFEKISGYSPEEIANWTYKEILALVSPLDRPAFFTKLLKAYVTGYKKPVVHLYKARHKSGGFLKVKIILTGLKQPDDSYLIVSTYIVLDDKLEEIQSEKTLSDFILDEKLIKGLKF